MDSNTTDYHPGLHRLALVTAGCTFVLLLAGALVTSTGSSLSVPDWPLSFGTFFPRMTGGVLFEHGHRMAAGTVAFLTLGLALSTQKVESRRWVKALAWSAMGAVLAQAVLGGVTVLLHLPTIVSVCHAGLAQVFFCLTVTMALVTSKDWILEKPGRLVPDACFRPAWAALATGAIYAQILLGALTRHSGAGLAIPDYPLSFGNLLPPEWSFSIALQFSHTRVGAILILFLVTFLSLRVCNRYPEEKGLFAPAAAAGLLVWIQCFLGLMVIFTRKAILPTSVHVIIGAALLGSMALLSLKSFQLFKKDS